MRISRGKLTVLAIGLAAALGAPALAHADDATAPAPQPPATQPPPPPPQGDAKKEGKEGAMPGPLPPAPQPPPQAGGLPVGPGQPPPGQGRRPQITPPPPSLGGRQLPQIGTRPPPPIETIDDPTVGLIIDGEKVDRATYGEALIEEYGTSHLEQYVAAFLVERRAKELKVDVPAADLDAAIEKTKRDLIDKRYQGDEAKLRAALVQSGFTLEGWLSKRRRDLRRDMLAKAVVKADRDLGEAALRKEFEARYGKGGVTRKGHAILLSTQVWTSNLYTQADYDAERAQIEADAKRRAEAARLELAKGRSFAELAVERSDDPMAQKGGDYGRHWRNRFGAEVDQRLAQLKPGETSEVIATPTGPIVARANGVHEGWELRAKQILLSTRVAGAGDAALRERRIAEEKAEAEQIIAAIRAGKTTFEDAARARSDHPRSKEKGGDLGTFMSGTLAPELEGALISMDEGALSGPVVGLDGVYVLQLVSKKRRPDLDVPLISIMRFSTEFLKVKERKLAGVIDERAKGLAEELVKRLQAGEDPAALAQKYSDEQPPIAPRAPPGEQPRRDEVGEIADPVKPGTPPEVERAFHALAKKGDTAVVKTDRGYHVIVLEQIESRDFEGSRAAIEKELREREPTNMEMREYRESLRQKAKVQKGRM